VRVTGRVELLHTSQPVPRKCTPPALRVSVVSLARVLASRNEVLLAASAPLGLCLLGAELLECRLQHSLLLLLQQLDEAARARVRPAARCRVSGQGACELSSALIRADASSTHKLGCLQHEQPQAHTLTLPPAARA
jgi:hypothetical protein